MNFLIPDRWAALAAQYPELTVGRITLQEKGMYRIRTIMGEQNALVSGKFQFDAQSPSDYPAVGDYVMVSCADLDTAVIHQVLPRKSLFVRKAAGTSKTEQVVAANIDTVFLCMSYALPNYNSRWGELVDYSGFIPSVNLQWQSEWAPWSPLRKDAVSLPDNWADMTKEQRALWWYRKSSYFDYGEVVSIGPAQYEGVIKLTLAGDSFLEVTLDEDGFLTSIYGPYPPGTIH